MNEPQRIEFHRYRGDGTASDGRPVELPREQGRYFAGPSLVTAVNTMLAVEQPLLVTGEAGTGKTALADSIAAELELGKVEKFVVRSDQQGRDLLYEIDNLQRFYDAQVKDPRAGDRSNYLRLGPLGRAFQSSEQKVVLIDEIDKAPRDFPDDLLDALDRMELMVPEVGLEIRAKWRPIVVITSNPESRLSDAFLRRCVFHYIEFPDDRLLARIVDERLGSQRLATALRDRVIERFLEVREVPGLRKPPATAELITWARVLARAGVGLAELEAASLADLPFQGTLCKSRGDLGLLKDVAR